MANNLSPTGFKEVLNKIGRNIDNKSVDDLSPEEIADNWRRLAHMNKGLK